MEKMKEFYINHAHFWVGNGTYEFEPDMSEEAIQELAMIIWGRKVSSTLDKIFIKGVIAKTMFDKITCNNWRRKHGLKMIKRDRKWQK